MDRKPEFYILSGKSGQEAYEHICNAKPLEKPLYSKEESKKFESILAPHLTEIIKEMKVANYQ